MGPRESDKALPYGYLVKVITDGWSLIRLSFALPPWPGPLVVDIHGEFMGPIADAIVPGTATVVEVFDPAKHIDTQEGAAIVREIEFISKPPENATHR